MSQARLDIDLLLSVAATEFAKHGFEAMSLRTLAELCSVSQPAIYYHFSSKEALYEEVCSRRFDEISQLIDQRVATVDSAEEKFEEFFSAMFEPIRNDDLTASNIPSPTASWDQIKSFAGSFIAYNLPETERYSKLAH